MNKMTTQPPPELFFFKIYFVMSVEKYIDFTIIPCRTSEFRKLQS